MLRVVGARGFVMELTLWLGHNYSPGTRVWTKHGDGVVMTLEVFYDPAPRVTVRLDDDYSVLGFYIRELILRAP